MPKSDSEAPQPDSPFQQALAHHRAGRLPEAEALYRQILQADPNHGDALYLLSVLAYQLGQYAAAVELADRALVGNPNIAVIHAARGNALAGLHQYPAAIASFDVAIQLDPNYAVGHSNRANALHGLRQFQAAIESCDRALKIDPGLPEAWNNRGNSFFALQQYHQAQRDLEESIRLKPGFAEAWNNLGTVLYELQQVQPALDAMDRAIQLNPNLAQPYNNRGNVLQHLEQYPLALDSFSEALRLDPACDYAAGMCLHVKLFLCDWDHLEAECRQLDARIHRNQKAAVPFLTLAISNSPALQKQAAEIYVRDRCPAPSAAAPIPLRPQHDRIRIGYFSANFHRHAVCVQMIDIFERHDRSKFEIIGFSFGPNIQDEMTQRVSAAMDQFIDVRSLSDHEVAELSRKLEIDIAVDLMGFTEHFRLGIFARRAAPIQVSYLGYPGTTGTDYMDYLIADSTLVPDAGRPHYSEKIVSMPDSFQANSRHPISQKQYTRSDEGLPEQGFIFCCFNNSYKITPSIFDIWMRVLLQVDGSVLWLLEGNPTACANLRKEAARRGIDPQRLHFARRLPLAEHLSRQRVADLFLDTLPFNAGATASPALWAGLPVLTCMGETFASRMGASLLRAVGLPELIAADQRAYQSLAISLALQPERLRMLREKLDRNRLIAPLFDSAAFTRHLETAYTAMLARHHAALTPDHIHITADQAQP